MVEIEIPGLASLERALADYPEIAQPEMELAGRQSMLGMIDPLTDYPPEPMGSSYRRSGNLGRQWTASDPTFAVIPNGFEVKLGNAAPYGPYVQDEEQQASVHQGRWPTVQSVARQREPNIKAVFEQAAQRVAAEINRRVK